MIVVFWTVMIGFMSGAFVKYFTPKLKQGEIFVSMTVGLVGSVLFEWLGSKFHLYLFGDYIGLVAAFIGSASLLYFYHAYIVTYVLLRPPNRRKI